MPMWTLFRLWFSAEASGEKAKKAIDKESVDVIMSRLRPEEDAVGTEVADGSARASSG